MKCHVQAKIDEYDIDATIIDAVVVGSRCRGLEKDSSDLDVVVELSTNEREDDLFNAFNEDGLHIGEVKVDINPITAQRTGTLETYLPQAEKYLESIRQENVMRGLMEILRNNLREGDVITHFSPTTVAMLLPTVDYNTGDGVMDRIKQKFYQAYPNSNVLFNYRIAPLSANAIVEEPQKPRRGRGRAAKGTAKEKTAP